MSQQPPPPYGGPPSSPYGGPAGPYPPGQSGGDGGMSNKAKFWIGVVITLPVMFLAGVLTSFPSVAFENTNADPAIGGIVSLVVGLALFAGWVMMIVIEKTRYIALGLLAGTGIVLILFAGACIVLIIGLSQSYS